jgi:hypothetical protein
VKPGARLWTKGLPAFAGFPGVAPEEVTIVRWRDRVHGPQDQWLGWHIVEFADGGRLCMHEGNLEVPL